jgi:DNA-binding PadR family transcriptional regulator
MSYRLNLTAATLLGFLHAGDATGFALIAMAGGLFADYLPFTRSQVYRELQAMAAAGLLVASAPGSRHRVTYTITDAGRRAFADWIRATSPGEDMIRSQLLLHIWFGEHMEPGKLTQIIAEYRQIHAGKLAALLARRDALTTGEDEPDPYSLAVLNYGIAHEVAVQKWLDELPPEIAG